MSESSHPASESDCSKPPTPEALRTKGSRTSIAKRTKKGIHGTPVDQAEPKGLSEKLGSKPLRLILVTLRPSRFEPHCSQFLLSCKRTAACVCVSNGQIQTCKQGQQVQLTQVICMLLIALFYLLFLTPDGIGSIR